MAISILEKNLNLLSRKLGYGAVTSYSKLWGTAINTFGKKTSSMWWFTIAINGLDEVVGIEVHSTYFAYTPQAQLIKDNATFDTPMTFEQVFELLAK